MSRTPLVLLLFAALLSAAAAARGAAAAPGDVEAYRSKVDRAINRGLNFLASQQIGGDVAPPPVDEDQAAAAVNAGKKGAKKNAQPKPGDPSKKAAASKPGKIAKKPKREAGDELTGAITDGLRGETGITSLGIMAFLSKGHTPGQGPYGQTINRGIDYLLDQQDENGLLSARAASGKANGVMYSHCISTLLLAEVSGMVDPARQRRIDMELPKALSLILKAQAVPKPPPHAGGWRYLPTSKDSDLSLTGWAIMALRAGKLNGAQIPSENIDKAVRYVLHCRQPQTGGFGYMPGAQPNHGLTAAAILCLELRGRHGHKAIEPASELLLKTEPKTYSNEMKTIYATYYGGQAAFQLGPDYWAKYAPKMFDNLLAGQQPDGGWPKSANLGRCFSTAMAILAMTPSYRQLPIYQRDESYEPLEKS